VEHTNSKPASTSSDLEKLLSTVIYGTRVGQVVKQLKYKDVYSNIDFISKNPNAKRIKSIYKTLCDIVHPNVLGNIRYWAFIKSKNPDGSEILQMERQAESSASSALREEILWSLGWSAATVRNGFEISSDAVIKIIDRWPKNK